MEFSIDFNKHYISVYEKYITKFEHILSDSDLTDRLYYEKTYHEILSNLVMSENDDMYDSAHNFISEMNKDITDDKCNDFPYLLGLLSGYYKIFLIKIKSVYSSEAMDILHGYAIELDYRLDDIRDLLNDDDVIPYGLKEEVSEIYHLINPIADNLKRLVLKSNHGGSRLNSGRKKEENTKQIRVPESLYTLINDLKIAYKDLYEEDKRNLCSSLRNIITAAEFEGVETNYAYDKRNTGV